MHASLLELGIDSIETGSEHYMHVYEEPPKVKAWNTINIFIKFGKDRAYDGEMDVWGVLERQKAQ